MSESVKHYLSRLKPSTAQISESVLNMFMIYLGENSAKFGDFTPDQLIKYQRNNPANYEILDDLQAWIRTLEHLRKSSMKRYYSIIVSFFAHNRTPLPPDPSYSVKNGLPSTQGSLKIHELRRAIEGSNPMYRALITCMAQGLMGIGEAITWSNNGLNELRENLAKDVCPIRINFPEGRKGSDSPFYTFIGRDAIAELRKYFQVRPDNDQAIFITTHGSPLTESTARHFWVRKLDSLAIINQQETSKDNPHGTIRYGKNLHEIRDIMRSRWRLSTVNVEIAEFFMGHSRALDEFGYDKSPWINPEWFRAEYIKAEPWLNILSDDPEKISRAEHEKTIKSLEQKYNEISQTVEELKKSLKR